VRKIQKQNFFRINFCIVLTKSVQYLSVQYLGADIQEFHFTQCSHIHCHAIFPLTLDEVNEESQHFCPKCRAELLNSHLVQCETCQSILNFIPLIPGEDATIFYVDQCSECSQSLKENTRVIPDMFRESFI